jgi:hypothetical protein
MPNDKFAEPMLLSVKIVIIGSVNVYNMSIKVSHKVAVRKQLRSE